VAYDTGEIAYGPMAPGWQLGILRIGFAYAAGCAMGRHARDIARIVKAPWWLSALVLCLALIRPGREQMIDGLGDLVTLLVFPLVLALSLYARPPRALHKWMGIAGAASWPLYALHLPILNMAIALVAHGVLAQSVCAPIAVSSTIVLSLLVGPSRLAKGFCLRLRTRRLRVARSKEPASLTMRHLPCSVRHKEVGRTLI
jgi:peptidoglycan/LPS O-acetylase OafA/YrhL